MQGVSGTPFDTFNNALRAVGVMHQRGAKAMDDALRTRDLVGGDRRARPQSIVGNICRGVDAVRGDEVQEPGSTWKGGPLAAVAKFDACKWLNTGESRVERGRQLETLAAVRQELRFQYPCCQQYR